MIFEQYWLLLTMRSCSWSMNSRYLLSASRDWNCVVWDVETGERRQTIKMDAPVQEAFFHPCSRCVGSVVAIDITLLHCSL